jgi:hypothetical protein
VLQTGFPVAGWAANTAPVVSISQAIGMLQLSRNGVHWGLRSGVNDGTGAVNQTDFVLINGQVVAATGDPIATGLAERYDDASFSQTFFANTVNNRGDYVVAGTTDNPDALSNAVLVLNGTRVIAREGNPVDLDGNGLFDDDAFIDVFGNDDVVMDDDRRIYLVASLRNGLGTAFANALLTKACRPAPGPGDIPCLIGLFSDSFEGN